MSPRAARPLLLVLGALMPAQAHGQAVAELEGVGHVLGRSDAPVTVVELADYACTFCGVFARNSMPRLKEEWIDTGRASFRFVAFHNSYYRPGRDAARAAECAAEQDAFWPMHDLLYGRQEDWLGRRGQKDRFRRWAEELGLEMGRFDACREDDPSRKPLERGAELAREHGVRGTPTFLVNDRVVVGALAYEDFRAILEEALALAGGGR